MVNSSLCPDDPLLQKFLLGATSDDEATSVEDHLDSCEHCLGALHQLTDSDDFTDAIQRWAEQANPEEEEVESLVRRVKDITITSIPESQATKVSLPPQTFPFLAESQSDGELGRLGTFRVLRLLGSGGMGMVFLAEDQSLHRLVALKVMKPEAYSGFKGQQLFLREARAMASIKCDNLVTIYQVGQEGEMVYLALEYLDGESLKDRLAREHLPKMRQVLRLGREIAAGLDAIHQGGLIHRDIKPANIWLESANDRVKIFDFGLARSTQEENTLTLTGVVVGTPAYMAPEQAMGKPAEARSDLFSLGCVLYEMCTSIKPFQGDTTTAQLKAQTFQEPAPVLQVNPEVPPPLADLVLQLLAKDPSNRPESAAEVVQSLRRIEEDLSSGSGTVRLRPSSALRGMPAGTGFMRFLKRPGVLLTMASGLVVASMLVIFGVLAGAFDATNITTPVNGHKGIEGWVDVRVYKKKGKGDMGLADFGALPLQNGDTIRVEARINQPAYLYLFWIDTEGDAQPIYPWKPGRWGTRPEQETKQDRLNLPKQASKGWPISGENQGMETVVMLVGKSPLQLNDDQLKHRLSEMPPQRPIQKPRSAVWFENGVVDRDRKRGAELFNPKAINDPVLRLQELLQNKLQEHVDFSRAVSFAKLGKVPPKK